MESAVDGAQSNTALVGEQRIARLGDRVTAAILDGITLFPIFIIDTALVAHWYHIPPQADGTISLQGGPALLSMVLDVIFWCSYYFFSEWLFDATLGKTTLAIKVEAADGSRCGVRRAFVRNFFRPLDGFGFYLLGFVVAIVSSRNQRIGDRIAGTVVREDASARRKRGFVGWVVFNVLLTLAAVYLF